MDGFQKKIEHQQLDDYAVFIDIGIFEGLKIPKGFRLIRVYTIYDVKVDGKHKSCFVTNGYLIATQVESVYSGGVSLRSLHMYAFIGELDGMIP